MFVYQRSIKKTLPRKILPKTLVWSLLLLGLATGPASARTLSVPESSPTIKGALIQAQAGDIILVSCGTYYEHDISVQPGVALWSGTLQPGCVTIDAQGKGRVFVFADGDSNTALVGFTLRGAKTTGNGGAIMCRNSSPRISNCLFQDNYARNGGAIYSDATSHPVISNSLFVNNTALDTGGGVQCQGGHADLLQCAFENNHAIKGAGLALSQGTNVSLSGCSFLENSAGNTGGGIHVEKSECSITHSFFSKNWGGIGGSVLSSQDSDLIIEKSTMYGNIADVEGSVFAIVGQHPMVQDTILAFNMVQVLRADSAIPHFKGCNLFGNRGGDWAVKLRSVGEKFENISYDPLFVAPEFGNFSLRGSSSCLPGNNPSGNKGIVGAFGPVSTAGENGQAESAHPVSGFKAVRSGL